jgi:hypothetical protein
VALAPLRLPLPPPPLPLRTTIPSHEAPCRDPFEQSCCHPAGCSKECTWRRARGAGMSTTPTSEPQVLTGCLIPGPQTAELQSCACVRTALQQRSRNAFECDHHSSNSFGFVLHRPRSRCTTHDRAFRLSFDSGVRGFVPVDCAVGASKRTATWISDSKLHVSSALNCTPTAVAGPCMCMCVCERAEHFNSLQLLAATVGISSSQLTPTPHTWPRSNPLSWCCPRRA